MNELEQHKILWARFWEIYYSFLRLVGELSYLIGFQASIAMELRDIYVLLFRPGDAPYSGVAHE